MLAKERIHCFHQTDWLQTNLRNTRKCLQTKYRWRNWAQQQCHSPSCCVNRSALTYRVPSGSKALSCSSNSCSSSCCRSQVCSLGSCWASYIQKIKFHDMSRHARLSIIILEHTGTMYPHHQWLACMHASQILLSSILEPFISCN